MTGEMLLFGMKDGSNEGEGDNPDNLQVFSRTLETAVDAGGDWMKTSKEGFCETIGWMHKALQSKAKENREQSFWRKTSLGDSRKVAPVLPRARTVQVGLEYRCLLWILPLEPSHFLGNLSLAGRCSLWLSLITRSAWAWTVLSAKFHFSHQCLVGVGGC